MICRHNEGEFFCLGTMLIESIEERRDFIYELRRRPESTFWSWDNEKKEKVPVEGEGSPIYISTHEIHSGKIKENILYYYENIEDAEADWNKIKSGERLLLDDLNYLYRIVNLETMSYKNKDIIVM